MIVYSIVITDTSWLAGLMRQLFKLLRRLCQKSIKSTAEFHLGEDDNGDEENQ